MGSLLNSVVAGDHDTGIYGNRFRRRLLSPAISLRKVLSCYLEQVIGVVAGSHATDMCSNWFCTCSLRPQERRGEWTWNVRQSPSTERGGREPRPGNLR